MELKTLPLDIANELHAARLAELQGNRGQARVCARRAAGMAVREYFKKIHHPQSSVSLYHLLELFLTLSDISAESKRLALILTTRVSTDFDLPSGLDLVEVSRSFCGQVLQLK